MSEPIQEGELLPDEEVVVEKNGKRAKLGKFLHKEWAKGKELSTEQLIKAKLQLQHSLGLGPQPNVIPPGPALVDGDLRTVEIGWHPVPGMGALTEKSGLGGVITKGIGKFPDPTQHWAVLIGDYAHELWMDEGLDVIYINERVEGQTWRTFTVGMTRFTDEAVRLAAEMVIHNMRATRPAYNLISNNCQNYAVNLLDAIQIGAHQEFATTFAIYQAATGAGTIRNLFMDKHPEEQKLEGEVAPGGVPLGRQDTVQNAQMVMEQETTKLDNHRGFFHKG